MADANNDQVDFALHRKEDGLWLEHERWGPVNLGPYEAAADAMAQSLAEQDFGERLIKGA